MDNNAIVAYRYGHDLINQDRAGTVSYYHYDGLGSTRHLSDSLGSLTDSYDYEAFGETLSQTGSTVNNYLFTGEQLDASLSQYYLRARYYDQGNGRFTQMDTWMGNNHDPVTLHKYLYANADPGNMIDPTGNFSIGSVMSGLNVLSNLVTGATTAYDVFQIASGDKEFSARELGTSILLSRLPVKFVKNLLTKACKVNSFEEGTLVSTDNGLQPISKVNIGDLVWSYDVESDEFVLREVTHLIESNGLKEIVEVSFNSSETILATADHPFYLADSETWVVAKELKQGDDLLNIAGNIVNVSGVKITLKDTSVYNLTVSDLHNYFVGNQQVLNHNNNCFKLNSRIKENPRLAKEAEKAGKNKKAQKDIDDLTKKLSEGNLNPGKGTKPIGKGISEARGENAGRVYFRVIKGEIEILGKSDKSNQDIVIKEILRTFK
ncbi:polymorphic toxin-type HINT domain-containing protein [Agarilytica rhodophyticola]|uniref:polymorphic toxin-type HINT domain-containing protein n=1 Tax=Agarilytica rhodophyticola TaxID=1737490 RepID=UPI001C2001BD|nr:polymorphic toxin-type HINT domain-containing protein [Agarilytica rhodophyticola]